MLSEKGDLDPALVYQDGDAYYLAAGFHRREAYRKVGRSEMPCIVRVGTKKDAIFAGIRDNCKHLGERLTRADRRHNVQLLLQIERQMSDCEIAGLVHVSHTT